MSADTSYSDNMGKSGGTECFIRFVVLFLKTSPLANMMPSLMGPVWSARSLDRHPSDPLSAKFGQLFDKRKRVGRPRGIIWATAGRVGERGAALGRSFALCKIFA